MESLFGSAGQLCDRNDQRTVAVRTPFFQTFECRTHHLYRSGGMDIHHVDIERRKHFHRLAHRIGNVMKFQIKKNSVSPASEFSYNLRTSGIEQFHTDLDERLLILEIIEERIRCLRRCEIACYYNVFIHYYIT